MTASYYKLWIYTRKPFPFGQFSKKYDGNDGKGSFLPRDYLWVLWFADPRSIDYLRFYGPFLPQESVPPGSACQPISSPLVVRLEPLNRKEYCSSYIWGHHKPHIYIRLSTDNTKIDPKGNQRVTTLKGAGWTHIHQTKPGSSTIGNSRTRIRVWRESCPINSTI